MGAMSREAIPGHALVGGQEVAPRVPNPWMADSILKITTWQGFGPFPLRLAFRNM
jgi:hypothetical protein